MVLVVEDDEPKQRTVVQYLTELLPTTAEVLSAESLSSAIRTLSERKVALAVVDMSLPTFDFASSRGGGGQPQGFGGADILQFIETETEDTLSVVLTQYEEFVFSQDRVSRDLRGLELMLKQHLGGRFLGVIHYAGQHGAWRDELKSVLASAGIIQVP